MNFDTYIIGCQKAVISYLKDILSQHPDIESHLGNEFAGFLEPHHINEEILQKRMKQKFLKSQLTGEKHFLGKKVGLFVSQYGFNNLFKHNENIKLFVVLRNPIDRIF